MAKRKTPKAKATPNTTATVTIDGAEIQVPILVSNMLKDQRQTIDYLEHILLLWHYKQYGPNKDEISKDKSKATAIANYLGITANDTGHWHKLGAQFEGTLTKKEASDLITKLLAEKFGTGE